MAAGQQQGSSRVACKPSACIVNAVRQGGGVGGRPRTLRQESLRSPWGQVKSTKGFGNFAIPTSGSPGVLGHGEQLWNFFVEKSLSKIRSATLVIFLVPSLARSLRSLAREGTGGREWICDCGCMGFCPGSMRMDPSRWVGYRRTWRRLRSVSQQKSSTKRSR